jgi:hypothetical protein
VEAEPFLAAVQVESVTLNVVAGEGFEGVAARVAHDPAPASDDEQLPERGVEPAAVSSRPTRTCGPAAPPPIGDDDWP